MSLFGVERRRRRLEGGAGRIFLLALDHGVAAGPVPGIERLSDRVRRLRSAPFSGLVVNPGMVRSLSADIAPAWGLIVHLSASTLLGSRPGSKVLASTVEHAVSLGADAVSVQISFGDSREDRMIADAGRVVSLATSLGLPVFLMAHAPAEPGESSKIPSQRPTPREPRPSWAHPSCRRISRERRTVCVRSSTAAPCPWSSPADQRVRPRTRSSTPFAM